MNTPEASVAVVGAGALGTRLLLELLKLPIARITVIDGDLVEATNIGRQPLYDTADVGRQKSLAAVERLRAMESGKALEASFGFLDSSNAITLLSTCAIVADCTDDLHAKGTIDRACAQLGLPLVSGALHAKQGQVIEFADSANGRPTRADLFKGRIGPDQDGCDMRLVPFHVVDAVATRMAASISGLLDGARASNGAVQLFEGGMNEWMIFQPAAHDHG